MDDLIERLRNFEGSDALGNGDFSLLHEAVAALEAAREDAARLDWLDSNTFTAYRAIDPIDGLARHCVVVDESKKPRRGNTGTIREAIDAAREARND